MDLQRAERLAQSPRVSASAWPEDRELRAAYEAYEADRSNSSAQQKLLDVASAHSEWDTT